MGDSLYIPSAGDRAFQSRDGEFYITRADGYFGVMEDDAHTGAVGTDVNLMAYQKQLITDIRTLLADGDVDDVIAALYGASGIAAFPAAALAANGVGLAEVIRYIQDAVRKSGGTALGLSKSLVDAIGSTGSLLLYGAGNALGAVGTKTVARKSVVGDTIPNNAQTLTICQAEVGDLLIEEIMVNMSGAAGWSNPNNIEFTTDNVSGLTGVNAPILLEAIATFGVQSSFGSKDADTNRLPIVLENGKSIFLHGDDAVGIANGTGAITVIGTRLADGAGFVAGL